MVVLAPAVTRDTRVCRPGYAAGEYGSGRAGDRVTGIELGASGTDWGPDQ